MSDVERNEGPCSSDATKPWWCVTHNCSWPAGTVCPGRSEPQTYDEAAERVHRAFCDPDHELVGYWDQAMADALRTHGYAIATVDEVAVRLHDVKGGGPFGIEGECECESDARFLLGMEPVNV